ncbi:MAG TPA: DUF2336 domain-containing protein [Stellaceae bacterium]|nr:DUF2336 domain-containing protein [Stellaceae bacterium]
MKTLTQKAIAEVIEKASWTERAKSLERLARRFADDALDHAEWRAAIEAFRVVLYDSEPLVRLVLAESVKASRDLPGDVLLALARDIAMVAAPVLEHSPLLTDDDLLPMAQRATTAHRLAIAGRRGISGRLAAALCRLGERAVILRLLANDGATLTPETLDELLDHYPDDDALDAAIGRRRVLPVSIGSRRLGRARETKAPQMAWSRTGSLG